MTTNILDRIDTSENRTYFPKLKDNARGSCGECSQRIRVQNASELSRGQHIEMPVAKKGNKAPKYMHHAVITNATPSGDYNVEVKLVHMARHKGYLQLCGERDVFDLKKQELYVIHYYHPRYAPEQVAKRAEDALANASSETHNNNYFSSYNLLTRNCEHFATWCVVGEKDTYKSQCWADKMLECLCKWSYSRQVRVWITRVTDSIRYVFEHGSKAMHLIQELLSDRTSHRLNRICMNIHKTVEKVSFVTSVIYCVCCGVYPVILYMRKRNASICKGCYDKKIRNILSRIFIKGVTSATTFLVNRSICIPTVYSVPLLIFFSVALNDIVSRISEMLLGPNCCTKTEISQLGELKIADVVTILYYGLPHVILITNIYAEPDDKKGKLIAIHYGTDGLTKRAIREESFSVDLSSRKIKRHECLHLINYKPDDCVVRARKRIGETKWNPVSNRSDHVCYWAKVNGPVINENKNGKSADKTRLSFWLTEISEVHLSEEIEIGDVIRYQKKECFVIAKTGNVRLLDLKVIFVERREKDNDIHVDLNIDTIQVLRYHPAVCFAKGTRAKRAKRFKNEAISGEKFKEKCIFKACADMK